jgi:hypothetical protein
MVAGKERRNRSKKYMYSDSITTTNCWPKTDPAPTRKEVVRLVYKWTCPHIITFVVNSANAIMMYHKVRSNKQQLKSM